ncbi:MAG: hypothetical protein QXY40_04490 [Candidatus Methanomethylicia archaeon]
MSVENDWSIDTGSTGSSIKCSYCGYEVESLQGLRAHLRWCKRKPRRKRVSSYISQDSWEGFKRFSKERDQTICHTLESLISSLSFSWEGSK